MVTFGALPKVTRCKSGTLSSRYRSNGYVPPPTLSRHQALIAASTRAIYVSNRPTKSTCSGNRNH
ncbi:MAG: hypothetical protein CFE47_11495 [Pseudomonas sp. PGPPP1]|nr:MAG: hypothetical protein CFE47_11495 [Pseudomonas sp. PGPPP1]